MVGPVVDDPDQEEHAGRANAVGDHLEHGAVDAPGPILRPGAADQTAMPRITYPMWLTELYATSFLKSVWAMAANAP